MLQKKFVFLIITAAFFMGRCTYSVGDKRYDLSRFSESATAYSIPKELRGIIPSNQDVIEGIVRKHQGPELRFVVIGDTVSNKNRTFKSLLAGIAELEPSPSFIIHLGDRVLSPAHVHYGFYFETIKNFPAPILHVDGNHDIREEGDRISRTFFGERDFFFDLGDIRFIFMSNVHLGKGFGFSQGQMEWLEDKLDTPYPTKKLFFSHVPPKAAFREINPGISSLFTPKLENEDRFLDLLAEFNVAMAAFGHRHVHASKIYRGVLMLITGGGGQRNSLEPVVSEPRFTKKNHYVLVDMSVPMEPGGIEGVLSCMDKSNTPLFISSFFQVSPYAVGFGHSAALRPSYVSVDPD